LTKQIDFIDSLNDKHPPRADDAGLEHTD
jgi:hypothetical protein